MNTVIVRPNDGRRYYNIIYYCESVLDPKSRANKQNALKVKTVDERDSIVMWNKRLYTIVYARERGRGD